MSINAPRYPGPYAQRKADCESAIERDFLREVITLSTPYIDLDRILASVAEPATLAGWTEEELTDAVIRLAARHGMERSQRL